MLSITQDILELIRRLLQQVQSSGVCEAGGGAQAQAQPQEAALPPGIYNMGGPDRLSRLDMAMEVRRACAARRWQLPQKYQQRRCWPLHAASAPSAPAACL